ncbi:phosphatidylglycerol lysyltransferase domain-containing protein [Metabacillus fastidiosus]|uniref:phosphatidylglycerol lysyltransferase domain-containing protein n=1 Tax=Metabacillus fastidiosus TaxID=1458 RepID=UPI002DB7F345|nr:phosphatidylglycerol lysyltransferase domain-containing protein [Metabacillus fastidiosus]MEC2077979.1 phosphatidylglycerol lysyltransferase domain-containing protein [Metabacillus fastidiosus]
MCYYLRDNFYQGENSSMMDIKILNSFRKKYRVRKRFPKDDFNIYPEQLSAFLRENGGNHASHLIFLQDKGIFWNSRENALITYKRIANKLVVLGDPIGEEAEFKDAIKEFCEYGKSRGLKPVFYQISPKYMQHYHDLGYRFLKLGEEGLVNLEQFSLEGKQNAKLRTRFNKFTRNFYKFNVLYPPFTDDFLSELKQISDSWLSGQKEKGFSVVSFSEKYVTHFPIAVLYGPSGNIIAFSTLATDYKVTVTIDLMRKLCDSPHGTMDVLFLHIFKWAKDEGYQYCSLGMTPLSNVGDCKHSFTSEKIARLAYLYGNSLYNFKGLKEFKNKFASNWESKYLAYKKTSLPIVCLQLLLLINRKHSSFKEDDREKYEHLKEKHDNKIAF